jgi:uncharacterized membrane protein
VRWARWLATARAPGGKSGVDPPSVHRDTVRLVAFSDAVFAITVTLLALEIRAPADYGQVWANHHVMFDHIRLADRAVLLLNTLPLMVVALLPFAASVLAGAL